MPAVHRGANATWRRRGGLAWRRPKRSRGICGSFLHFHRSLRSSTRHPTCPDMPVPLPPQQAAAPAQQGAAPQQQQAQQQKQPQLAAEQLQEWVRRQGRPTPEAAAAAAERLQRIKEGQLPLEELTVRACPPLQCSTHHAGHRQHAGDPRALGNGAHSPPDHTLGSQFCPGSLITLAGPGAARAPP